MSLPASKTFTESIGVNVHTGYNNSVYANLANTNAKITEMGFRHVRDGGSADENWRWQALGALPATLDLIIGSEWIANTSVPIARAKTYMPNLGSVEGLNEYDISGDPNWRTVARAHNDALREAMRKDAALIGLPTVAPSIVWDTDVTGETDEYLLNADRGNSHPYTGGAWETTTHATSALATAHVPVGQAPIWLTEYGWHTETSGYHDPGNNPVTETQQRDRMIAGLLEQTACGAERVYIYELADLWTAESQEGRWGLYHHDWTAKPAATALKRWLTWMSDSGTPSTTENTFGFTITDPNGIIRSREFVKSNGDHYLALWQMQDSTTRNIQVTMNDGQYKWTFGPWRGSYGDGTYGWATNAKAYSVPSVGNEPVLLLIRHQP